MSRDSGIEISRRHALALGAGALLSACGRRPTGIRVLPRPPEQRFGRIAQPNVVVFLADALRADAIAPYNRDVSWTPTLGTFAKHCTLFERCYSQCNWTKPSIGSLFTGVLPNVHEAVVGFAARGVSGDERAHRLRDTFATLAELLGVVGYETAWFISNPMVHPDLGYGSGFDHAHFEADELPSAQMEAALEWLDGERHSPFFLFVHEIDPHGPYEPSPTCFARCDWGDLDARRNALSRADRDALSSYFSTYSAGLDAEIRNEALGKLSGEGRGLLRELYQAEVSGVDDTFARLLAKIDTSGYGEDTVVIFIADHGEAFGEHGQFGHARTLHREEIHVPLLIRIPGIYEQRKVSHTVSLFDLYATILTLAGSDWPDYVQAKPLLDANGNVVVTEDRAVFSEFEHGRPNPFGFDAAVIEGARKILITDRGRAVAGFDLAADPGETRDVLEERADLQALYERLRKARERSFKLSATFGDTEWQAVGEDTRDDLHALGYL